MEIDVIKGQKQNVILEILWLAHHNPKIDQRTGEVKITRCPEECRKQWIPKQGKSEWQKQKEEGQKEEEKKRQEEKEKEKKEKKKKARSIKDNRRMEDLERRGRSSKIRGRSKKASFREVP